MSLSRRLRREEFKFHVCQAHLGILHHIVKGVDHMITISSWDNLTDNWNESPYILRHLGDPRIINLSINFEAKIPVSWRNSGDEFHPGTHSKPLTWPRWCIELPATPLLISSICRDFVYFFWTPSRIGCIADLSEAIEYNWCSSSGCHCIGTLTWSIAVIVFLLAGCKISNRAIRVPKILWGWSICSLLIRKLPHAILLLDDVCIGDSYHQACLCKWETY